MPIHCDVALTRVDQATFKEIDWNVMKHAITTHRELGNMLREEGYQNDLMHRLSNSGIQASSEVPLKISYENFSRRFPCDLLVENSVIYECKTVPAFNGHHRKQLLHYLFAADLGFGKLLNFATPSLTFEYVSTRLTLSERRQFSFEFQNWNPPTTSSPIEEIVSALLKDWGSGLSTNLYKEALLHFIGRKKIQKKDVPIKRGQLTLTHHPILLFDDRSALHLTSLPKPKITSNHNLLKLKKVAGLKNIHWINIANHQTTFRTL